MEKRRYQRSKEEKEIEGKKGRKEEREGGREGGVRERKQRERIKFHFKILPIFNARGLHWTLNKVIKY